jgi:hypothetical protein
VNFISYKKNFLCLEKQAESREFSKTITVGRGQKRTLIFLFAALFKLNAITNKLETELGEDIQCKYKRDIQGLKVK